MKLPRVRFSLRWLMVAVVVSGALLGWTWRLAQHWDYPEAGLILLEHLRFTAILLTPSVMAIRDAVRIVQKPDPSRHRP